MSERFSGKTTVENLGAKPEGSLFGVAMQRNNLLVNGKKLTPQDGTEVLRQALTGGRDAILQGLEDYRLYRQQTDGREESLSPFSVVFLGSDKDKALSEAGKELSSREMILSEPEVLKDELVPLYHAIAESGFTPSVRVFWIGYGYDINLWADLPKPE